MERLILNGNLHPWYARGSKSPLRLNNYPRKPERNRLYNPKQNGRPTYVIECPMSGKKFNRKKYGTQLNPHKTKDGFPCSNRTGYLVDTRF
jgi:hypothetical protein